MENVKWEDLLAASSKGIEMGSKATVAAVFILGAQAITMIGGLGGGERGGCWGLPLR